MSHPRSATLKKMPPLAALATAVLAVATLFVVANTARGASSRAQVATIDVTQLCANRVEPNSPVAFQVVVQNTGDEGIAVTLVDADAGTPENETDDIVLTTHTGDIDNDNVLDTDEDWTYPGSYNAPSEDVTNIAGVDAISVPGGTSVSDIAPCETDVVQQAEAGVIVGVREVSGKVLVRKAGSTKFVDLNGVTEIPVGSQVDTLRGTVRLTAGLGGGQTQHGRLLPGRLHDPPEEGARCVHDAAARRRELPQLWPRGEGTEHPSEEQEAGAKGMGQRQGQVHDPRPVQLGDRARDEVADVGSLRRDTDPRAAGHRPGSGLPGPQERERSCRG